MRVSELPLLVFADDAGFVWFGRKPAAGNVWRVDAQILLLIGAWASYRARSWGALFLLLAWAYFTGLMSSSFWWQLEETIRQTSSEPNSFVVLIVKFLLWATCVTSLVLSFRRVARVR